MCNKAINTPLQEQLASCFTRSYSCCYLTTQFLCYTMDLIHYLFAPLILFCVPYTLDLLSYYLSIANGAGGVGILNFSYFNVLYRSYPVNNTVIDVLHILMYYYTGILFVVLCKGWISYTSLFAGNLP